MRQLVAITLFNIASTPSRWGSSLVVVVGVAGVVVVLTFVLTLSVGLINTLGSTSRENWAIIVRDGALAESLSAIPRDSLAVIEKAPMIKTRKNGSGLSLDPQLVVPITLQRSETKNVTGSVLMRGLTNDGLETTPNFKLVEGRMFAPGKHELIVGAVISDEYLDLQIDDELAVRGVDWHIVGRFSTAGNAMESELLGDLTTVMSANKRTAYSSIRVQLDDAGGITELIEFVEADPRLKVDAMWESEYFQAGPSSAIIGFVAYVVSGIMAVGAVFGALNVMYSTVADRAREIATLRAFGFLPGQVAASVIIESMLLALVGAVVGVLICALAFHGSTFTTGSLTSLTTALKVTPAIIALSMVAGCAIGFVGGVVPAIGAARRSIVDGLRSQY